LKTTLAVMKSLGLELTVKVQVGLFSNQTEHRVVTALIYEGILTPPAPNYSRPIDFTY